MSDLIILEGLDGHGKTTTAERLSRLTDRCAIVHAGHPVATTWPAEYVRPLNGLAAGGYRVVCDRWHLGELVWPWIFGRDPILQPASLDALEQSLLMMFAEVSAYIVHRDSSIAQEYDQEKANYLYDHAARTSRFDWEICTPDEIVDRGWSS